MQSQIYKTKFMQKSLACVPDPYALSSLSHCVYATVVLSTVSPILTEVWYIFQVKKHRNMTLLQEQLWFDLKGIEVCQRPMLIRVTRE